ncbi:MAG: polysaccharide biosynthesis protein [Eubacteriaceae bacterium]
MRREKQQKLLRIFFLIGLDIIALFGSYYLSSLLIGNIFIANHLLTTSKVYVFAGVYLKILILGCLGMYNTLWRFASIEELAKIMIAVAVGNLFTDLMFVFVGFILPFQMLVIGVLLDFLFIGGIRISYRLVRRAKILEECRKSEKVERVLIFGAGEAGVKILKELYTSKERYEVVGFIDDDPLKKNRHLNNVPVLGGREVFETAVKLKHPTLIIIAIPSTPQFETKKIASIAHETGIPVKILPHFDEILNFDVTLTKLRDLQIEDLLNRDEVVLNKDEISNFIKGKTILVTGGSGSIGSELCRQIIRFSPKEMIVVDIYENTLYYLELELQRYLKTKGSDIPLHFEIGSIRDEERVDEIFKAYQPQIVFHAAAHKHVPLMEKTPKEAVKNNVFGTKNLLDASVTYGVEKFVQISTDKAVKPTNVMGTTKRICEIMIQAYNRREGTDFVAVRFGNVLGSNGSVIPIFKEQIQNGGPVMVTHKNIERFFMTIPEATQLVLQAGSIASGGEIFVLDMGKPVKILDLAEKMVLLSGLEPYTDINIVFTGLRPGEKLYEELSYDLDSFDTTMHSGIFVEKIQHFENEWMNETLGILKETAENGTNEDVIEALHKMVPDYYPNR